MDTRFLSKFDDDLTAVRWNFDDRMRACDDYFMLQSSRRFEDLPIFS
jgi:hypothetical protein